MSALLECPDPDMRERQADLKAEGHTGKQHIQRESYNKPSAKKSKSIELEQQSPLEILYPDLKQHFTPMICHN
ncbi:hypothetical protein RRG08_034225 [Elysia crispata]|uniref:Uncharacterized protein n=1 Tax=Elysia crispata TaxID=231223 RepID=A0AAE1DQB8_9GAST|nr:hypothetical protein RRG08_034225 [Elysia crispata]